MNEKPYFYRANPHGHGSTETSGTPAQESDMLPDRFVAPIARQDDRVIPAQLESLVETDRFGLLEHTDLEEVVNRRVLDEAEGLVISLSNTRDLRKKHDDARKHGGSVRFANIELSDAYRLCLEATYSGRTRSYSLTRSDEFATGNEGFKLVFNSDDSVIIRALEENGNTPLDDLSQDELFAGAKHWIHALAARNGITPETILDYGRGRQAPERNRRLRMPRILGRLGHMALHSPSAVKAYFSDNTRSEKVDTSISRGGWTSYYSRGELRKVRARRTAVGVCAVGLAFALAPSSSSDLSLGPVRMPQPIEGIADLMNYGEHREKGFQAPEGALILDYGNNISGGIIPLIEGYDTEGAPATNRRIRNGLNRLELTSGSFTAPVTEGDTDPDACTEFTGNFEDHTLHVMARDPRIGDNANYVAKIVGPNLGQICSIDGTMLQDGSVYIYQD